VLPPASPKGLTGGDGSLVNHRAVLDGMVPPSENIFTSARSIS